MSRFTLLLLSFLGCAIALAVAIKTQQWFLAHVLVVLGGIALFALATRDLDEDR